ncbi:hypothetical protein [Methylobacterium radiotolerans]|uniref:DUF4440 domain-containing protein n=1 Tax=Methylobacterium radiotolerans (strain ATCC 27329 / DSM 1819 / JCM 2831 / NBRC 15690 / NCIMB 10815 / 0-1) TaxID=426355 RepID=B1M9W5_METRJ|nr:hypothetical protein [Methylobacterium radiotolerans]ACB28290.1 hypothetical protein Mrad2831_6368 [Methylobacterium radiotolerans JCM 2831]GEN01271.1 hypothetical protein MRA01_58100 [Methylobacterium radiotolerans]
MKRRWLTATLLILILPGAYVPAAAMQTAKAVPAAVIPATAHPELPQGACDKTQDGFSAFLDAIVTDPALRAAYSAPQVAERDLRDPSKPVVRPSEPFRLTIIDNQWSYDEPGRDPGKLARVDLSFKLAGNQMRLGFVRAKFSPGDDLIKTYGPPEAYVFEHMNKCWRLVQHLR